MKRLWGDEIENMRDLGGYFTQSGKSIKENLLVRSNLPKCLSDEVICDFVNKGITTIIDLRTDEEIAKAPSVFIDNQKFDWYHVQMGGNAKIPDTLEGVVDSYVEILEWKCGISKVFKIIAKASGGVLFHCTTGKDRTGVIAAVLLKLLGVRDDDIVADYIVSGAYLKSNLDEFASNQLEREIITPRANTMFEILDYITKRYVNVEEYLKICGVTEDELLAIRKRVL